MIDATLHLLPLWVVGYAGAWRLVRGGREPTFLRHLEAMGLAPAVGALLASMSFFFAAVVTGRGVTRTSWTIAFSVVAVAFVALMRRPAPDDHTTAPPTSISRPSAIAAAAALVLVLATVIPLEVEALRSLPHGRLDAQAIWNVRARLLVRADGDWAARFGSLGLGHPDYPLLLPATVATLWTWSGTEDVAYPSATALMFLVGLVLSVFVASWRLGGPLAAALATPFVLWTPHVVTTSAGQFADVPLSLFLLVAWSGLASLQQDDPRRRASALSVGAALGGLAWTKNEGLLWAGVLALVWVVAEASRRRWGAVRLVLGPLCRAAAPALMALVLFKLLWAPANDLVQEVGPATLSQLGSWVRWQTALAGMGREMVPGTIFDAWRLLVGIPVDAAGHWAGVWPLLGATLVIGVSRRSLADGRDLAYGALSLGAMLVTIVSIYVVTPRDQDWHIRTAMDRLLLQIYPAIVVFVVAAVVRSRSASQAAQAGREPWSAEAGTATAADPARPAS